VYAIQGKRIGVISSIASNPNNDPEINAKFAQALVDLKAAGKLPFSPYALGHFCARTVDDGLESIPLM